MFYCLKNKLNYLKSQLCLHACKLCPAEKKTRLQKAVLKFSLCHWASQQEYHSPSLLKVNVPSFTGPFLSSSCQRLNDINREVHDCIIQFIILGIYFNSNNHPSPIPLVFQIQKLLLWKIVIPRRTVLGDRATWGTEQLKPE